MQFCCLGSGSKGNATLIRHKDTVLIVDCGFSLKHTLKRLDESGVDMADVTAVLVTHEHSDHINGVNALARKLKIPVYVTRGTIRSGKVDKRLDLVPIELDVAINIGDVTVVPVAVPHDAREPCQFVFSAENKQLGVMTDLGSISKHVLEHYDNCDALLLEANHDVDMLWSGRYPPGLKKRVAGNWGHLSNVQAAEFVAQINIDKLKTLVLGHISEQNNSLEKVKACFECYETRVDQLIYATQDQGFPWLSV